MIKTSLLSLTLSLSLPCPLSAAASAQKADAFVPLTIDDVLNGAQNLQTEMLSQKRFETLLLVSLSMPEASLKRLARDAKDAGIPLVFRGVPVDPKAPANLPLLNPQSLQAFNFLVELGASVELNPEAFRDFGLTEVPALVIREHKTKNPSAAQGSCAESSSSEENSAVVLGDVTLGYMLDSICNRQDEIGQEARRLRQKLGERE